MNEGSDPVGTEKAKAKAPASMGAIARARRTAAASNLYSYEKVYPRAISGRFRTIKWVLDVVLVGLFLVGPWLRWDRGAGVPDQAILLDMAGRRGYFFSIEIWPQEVYYLAGLMMMAAVALFLATALFGRVWCGFLCIQTVFTDIFVWIERLIEGDRYQRMRADFAPWTAGKLARKAAKNLLWLVVSVATSWAWLMYFQDAPSTTRALLNGGADGSVYGFLGLFAATTFVLAGYAREQVCIYMCPWPRIQGAMFDEDSLIVTYEGWRGEPRGPAKHGQSFAGRGHCIDCTLCVQVCPTGIDIRNGSQMACIGCALCLDACNRIMGRMGLPPNLIAYDSTANQMARSVGAPTRTRLVRPRTLVYAAILVAIGAAMAVALATRTRIELNVQHERSPLFVALADGSIRNGYTVKVLNMGERAATFTLEVRGVPDARLTVVGGGDGGSESARLPVKADTVGTFRVYVTVPRGTERDGKLTFVLRDPAGSVPEVRTAAVFAWPGK